MKKILNSLMLTAVVASGLSGCVMDARAYSKDGNTDLDSVFGGVNVGKGAIVRDVSSVNGGIDIESNAKTRNIEAVNGGIELGEYVSARMIETVNGSIYSGKGLTVEKAVETVNGQIKLGSGSNIGEDVITVNGNILLNKALVGRNVETNNGDVSLRNDTTIEGDLIIKKSSGWFFGMNNDEKVEITIDSSSQIKGNIILHKPVKLNISNKNSVGEIKYLYERK